MKKIVLLLLLTTLSFSVNAQVKWMTMQEAVEAQKKNNKPIFIDAYTVWCGPCKMLDKNTFSDAEVAKVLNEKYNPVKFNAEGNETIVFNGKTYTNPKYVDARKNSRNGLHEFARVIGVSAYPTMKVLDASGKATKNIVGYRNAQQLLAEL
ncbi:thioredoxin family protein [Avrilella dinanensis]|uniref:Thioredoxin n=1 Tax=Avrilella dinanensis TaxID=2008672 RepID=A0A2M9R851_9FLAO|nr:thioredoxin family protein [Avrilella dinanensis]PJR04923.1 thioredoxin [Avrilella dinanensis]